VADLKPAYLIHGDDHTRVGERRARLRALAEAADGSSGAEVFEGDDATPDAVAAALSAMTFATGRRFVIVDGVERWKDTEVAAALEPVLRAMPPETTVAFFAREDARAKAPASLHAAVRAAGGDIAAEGAVKPWELPKWVAEQGRRQGLRFEQGAAQALVATVGERPARLLRELEVLALEHGEGTTLTVEAIEERANAAERKAWTLADRLVARDGPGATRVYLELRAQGERTAGLLYVMARRLRDALAVAQRLEAGEPVAEVRRSLRMPPKAAERFVADVKGVEASSLRAALAEIADLEVATRGGLALDEDTATLQAILRIA